MSAVWQLAPEIAFLLSILLALALAGMLIRWVTRRRRPHTAFRPPAGTLSGASQPFERGFDLLLDGRWQEAAHLLGAAIKDDPRRIPEYLALGKLFRRQGQPARAARMFEQVLARPDLDRAARLMALYELALAYRSLAWHTAAVELLEQVLGADPSYGAARLELRRLHEELGQWDTAAALEMIRLQRGEASERRTLAALLTQHGKATWAVGQLQDGATHLRSALAADPGSVEATLCLGRLYLQRGEVREAFHLWDGLATHRPEFLYLAFRDIQSAFRHLQNDAGWENFLRRFTERHPGDPAGHLALADYYEAHDQAEAAAHCLRRVLELDPLCREAHLALLSLYRAQGASPSILEAYAQLAKASPWTCAGRCHCLACGVARPEPLGKCPTCHAWGSAQRRIPQAHGVPIITAQTASPLEPSAPGFSIPLATKREAPAPPARDR
jgi:lipopolysaccharide biosynthesis regulator YciM